MCSHKKNQIIFIFSDIVLSIIYIFYLYNLKCYLFKWLFMYIQFNTEIIWNTFALKETEHRSLSSIDMFSLFTSSIIRSRFKLESVVDSIVWWLISIVLSSTYVRESFDEFAMVKVDRSYLVCNNVVVNRVRAKRWHVEKRKTLYSLKIIASHIFDEVKLRVFRIRHSWGNVNPLAFKSVWTMLILISSRSFIESFADIISRRLKKRLTIWGRSYDLQY